LERIFDTLQNGRLGYVTWHATFGRLTRIDESDEEVAPAPSVPTPAAAPVAKRANKWEGEDEEASGVSLVVP
jgi:hypothetical protein